MGSLRTMVLRRLNAFLDGVEVDQDGVISFRYESTQILVFVTESDDWSTVALFTVTNYGVPRTGALYKYVAEWMQTNSFAGISVYHNDDGTDNVNLKYTMIGMNLHPDDLQQGVAFFALTADKVDDEVQSLFGGQRFIG